MSTGNGPFSVRHNLAVLRLALSLACDLYGELTDECVRAGLGYFVLIGARAGERDAKRLATYAVERFRLEPDILGEPDDER